MEIPHPETGQPPRTCGRVAWIQRPRTVRQLFQVLLNWKFRNVWASHSLRKTGAQFSDMAQVVIKLDAHQTLRRRYRVTEPIRRSILAKPRFRWLGRTI